MELAEGLAFVKPPRRAVTIDGYPTLGQLQRRLPKAEGSLVVNPPTAQMQKWAVEIWQRLVSPLNSVASLLTVIKRWHPEIV
jgi:hypothetical protein